MVLEMKLKLRWVQKENQFVKLKRPEFEKKYNKVMGGVDKLDHLIRLYRIAISSLKWPLRMISHAFGVAVVNNWLEYGRDNENKGTQPQKIMDLLEFKMNMAEVLVKKRGRPSNSNTATTCPTPHDEAGQKRGIREWRPVLEVQTDMVDHLPNDDREKEATRCKLQGCSGMTHIFCDKCKVHHFFVSQRNCFKYAKLVTLRRSLKYRPTIYFYFYFLFRVGILFVKFNCFDLMSIGKKKYN